MPYAELRPVDMAGERPSFEVWTDPWSAERFEGPPDQDWSSFNADEDGATYEWRGGPDILRALAADVAAGRATAEDALSNERVGWWLEQQLDAYPDLFCVDDDGDELSPEEGCLRLLQAVGDGSLDFDGSEGDHAYYDVDSTSFLTDAARALDLPPWARRESFEAGGPGSSYGGWRISLDPGRTLKELEVWLDDQERSAG